MQFTETLLDSMQAGVIACDATGRIVVVNRALRELHELPASWPDGDLHDATTALLDRLRHPSGAAIHPDDTPLRLALDGRPTHLADVRLMNPGRPTKYVDLDARPVRAADGSHAGAVATIQDVTAERRAAQVSRCELQVARVLAHAPTLEAAGPALVATIAEALGCSHVGLWMVDGIADTLLPAGQWTASAFPTDVMPDRIVRGTGTTGTAWQTGEPVWIPDLKRPPDHLAGLLDAEHERAAALGIRSILAVPLPGTPDPLGVLTCVYDQPQTDDALVDALATAVATQIGYFVAHRRERDLTRDLDRSRNNYVDLVGHELRTPITAIATYAELLAMSAETWPDDDRALLEVIARNTARVRALIEYLLDLSTIENGELSLLPERLDFAEVVEGAAGALESPSNIEVTVDAHTAELQGDRHRLRQVVDHLLSNAVKFSPDGGGIEIRLRTDHTVAILEITDGGLGVPVDERERVFDAFYRGSDVQHSGIPGAGLGLSLARTLTSAHGGTVTLDGGEPHGTRVTVRLPLGCG
ncbi:ATP-binding protein [Cryptosporangium phraense]|uniref:histidine kinase n=1 Tax=Cryptosporangium phraense TaxID=2593070 RepID=A0A545AMG8_9ACTN|nr:ATP-binding protein [Cryptosporangium phraense]TQS42507.1 GAF domain-containing protein [Cryptosporangium phraense]